MPVDSIDVRQNDDRTWYVNLYGRDEAGTTRRETIADNLTETEAKQLVRPLKKLRSKLTM